jgi:DNA polymerase-3 subunit delta'
MNDQLFPWLAKPWQALSQRRANLPHALLIHGRSGLGKTDLAKFFAQRLLCERDTGDDLPCGACSGCLWFRQGNHPDFRALEPDALAQASKPEPDAQASERRPPSRQIRIEQVREIQDFLAIGTHRGCSRVVLIRPAEAMNPATANALLKSLEEPPPKTVFLLVSSAPERLLPTISSRCQRVNVPPAAPDEAVPWLRKQGVNEAETALAFAGNAPLAALEEEATKSVRAGLIARLSEREAAPLELADACQDLPHATVISWLQKWSYDLCRLRLGAGVRFYVRHAAALQRLASDLDLTELLGFERALAEAARVAEHPLNARLFLEDLFLRYTRALKPDHG